MDRRFWAPILFGVAFLAVSLLFPDWWQQAREFLIDEGTLVRSLGALATIGVVVWGILVWVYRRNPEVEESEKIAARTARSLKAARSGYLDYLRDRFRYLDLKGLGVSDRVPLRLPLTELFVPLRARSELPEGETWNRAARVAGRELSEEEQALLEQQRAGPRKVWDLIGEHDGLVILGDPGSGKTTLLKYLAVALADGRGGELGLDERLPVLAPLSAFANALATEDNLRLDDFVRDYVHGLGAAPAVREVLSAELERGRVLFLLDGLDEVREASLRRTVVDRVIDLFTFHRTQGNKFLITSRIVGYREVRTVAEPTDEEWERAARETEGTIYPWGADFENHRANVEQEAGEFLGTTAVCTFPDGVSPEKLWDTAGNVFEWTQDPSFLPGGSFWADKKYARCAARSRYLTDAILIDVAFRVVLSLANSES